MTGPPPGLDRTRWFPEAELFCTWKVDAQAQEVLETVSYGTLRENAG